MRLIIENGDVTTAGFPDETNKVIKLMKKY